MVAAGVGDAARRLPRAADDKTVRVLVDGDSESSKTCDQRADSIAFLDPQLGGSPDADPLSQALGKKCLINKTYERALTRLR